MKKVFGKTALALMVTATLGWSNAALSASTYFPKFSATIDGSKAKRVSLKQKATPTVKKVQFLRGSEESVAERNSRLKRECKGGVNAGACAGHTR